MGLEFCLSCGKPVDADSVECPHCEYRPPKLLRHPKITDRFRLLRRLGGGAMGEVFLVEAKNLSNLRWALKVITDAHAADKEYIRRFHDEARIAAQLSAARVAKLQDYDVCDDIPFALWHYIDGITLADLIKTHGRLETRRALRLMIQLAEGLADIHRFAVHRDVKPSNLIIRDANTSSEDLYILDFGLTKAHDDKASGLHSSLAGTLPYMAPELFTTGSPRWQPTQDIYAAGIVLYEMLVGMPPFTGTTAGAIIHSICNQEPTWKGPFEAGGTFGGQLQALAQKALAKDPHQRYQEAIGLRDALLRVIQAIDDSVADETAVRVITSSPQHDILTSDTLAPYFSRAGTDFIEAELRFKNDWRQQRLIHERALEMVEELQTAAERLRGGELVTSYQDCSLLTECIAQMATGDELIGLSVWEADSSWWRSVDAQTFRRANAQALGNGAHIRRVFVYDGFPDGSPSFRELADEMERHAQLGVQVRTLERGLLNESYSTTLTSECVLSAQSQTLSCEPWLTYHVSLDKFDQPQHNVFSLRRYDIQRRAQRLEGIWEQATPFTTEMRKTAVQKQQSSELVCGADAFGSCEEPTLAPDESQYVKPDQNDGRRLYIHESSFAALAQVSPRAAKAIYSALVAVPVLKLLHHDIVQEAVFTVGFRSSSAADLEAAISRRWFTTVTDTFRVISAPPRGVEIESSWQPLLRDDETIVATCFDSKYYTFATTEPSAARMYRDNVKFSIVEDLVLTNGDAYRDLTLIKGPRLRLHESAPFAQPPLNVAWTSGAVSEEQLTKIKVRILADFCTDLQEVIKTAVPAPSFDEATTLRLFASKCERTVRQTVLRLSVSSAPLSEAE